jgi:hypothetical protein
LPCAKPRAFARSANLFGALVAVVTLAPGPGATTALYAVVNARDTVDGSLGHFIASGWLVVGRGLRLALAGTVLGVLGALAVSRVLAATASQLPPPRYPVIAALAALLMTVALLASWLPARRAAALDPMVDLRGE